MTTNRLIHLAASLTVLLACGSDERQPFHPAPPTPPPIAGALVGLTDAGDPEIAVAALQPDVFFGGAGGAGPPGAATGTLTTDAGEIPLTATIDETEHFHAEGGGYVLDGDVPFSNYVEGSYTGPSSSGKFALGIDSPRTLCGSFAGAETGPFALVEGFAHGFDIVVVTTAGRRSIGGGAWEEGAGGGPATVTADGPEKLHLDGTLEGDRASGTWRARDLSGTWSVAVDDCP